MIETTVSEHGIDPHRIYITGLSAGGAMANAMLAADPEVFAGGAIVAGPTVPEAFDRMRSHGFQARRVAGQTTQRHRSQGPVADDLCLARHQRQHGHRGERTGDRGAMALCAREVGVKPSSTEAVNGHARRAWKDASGPEAIEYYSVAGVGHDTPLDVASGYGKCGPFMLDAGISSTVHIARSWGLAASFERREHVAETPIEGAAQNPRREWPEHAPAENSIQAVIEKALRSAGLMR